MLTQLTNNRINMLLMFTTIPKLSVEEKIKAQARTRRKTIKT